MGVVASPDLRVTRRVMIAAESDCGISRTACVDAAGKYRLKDATRVRFAQKGLHVGLAT